MRIRQESEKGRALAKKWESDLAGKLKHLRDESKRASVELCALGRELEESKSARSYANLSAKLRSKSSTGSNACN